MEKKYWLLLLILTVICVGAWTLPIFPDPYEHVERVTFIEWIKREIDELTHGERT